MARQHAYANAYEKSASSSSRVVFLLKDLAMVVLLLVAFAPTKVDCFGGGLGSVGGISRDTTSKRLQVLPSLGGRSSDSPRSSSRRPSASRGSWMVSQDDCPFSPEELVAMAKDYTTNPSPDWWADDEFVFRAPVIGPLCKKDLVATLSANLDLQTAFPDLEANAFGFCADDPIEPNRVWYFVRPRGTFSGPFNHPTKGIIEPTNAPYIAPPEARSVVFNADGKIRFQSVGYVVDRFTGDTTGGRGAVFGQYAVMGEELDGNPGSWSTILLQKLSEYLPSVPQSYSKPEDLPSWWTDARRGAES